MNTRGEGHRAEAWGRSSQAGAVHGGRGGGTGSRAMWGDKGECGGDVGAEGLWGRGGTLGVVADGEGRRGGELQ